MFIKEMVQSMKKAGLVLSGAVAGVLLSLGLTAYADKKDTVSALPIEDVQKFSQVLSMIKNNYVDEVSDKDLIANAISGMVKELDPHSAYFDEKEFKELYLKISNTDPAKDEIIKINIISLLMIKKDKSVDNEFRSWSERLIKDLESELQVKLKVK